MTPFATGEPVLVRAHTGRELPCTVVFDGGGPQVLVRHVPAADQLLTTVFPVPRARVRSAVTPPPEPAAR